jgi:hypothetical protein
MSLTKKAARPSSRLTRKPGVAVRRVVRRARYRLRGPWAAFQSSEYMRINQRRLEHLATLGLPLANSSVLEVGAGIGDHTTFFLDRGCQVITSDGRDENVAILRRRYPSLDVRKLDLDHPGDFVAEAEIVYCYGLLYHLQRPEIGLSVLQRSCRRLLLLETCVSLGDDSRIVFVEEPAENPSQALGAVGCRPTRRWVYEQLKDRFAHVYIPRTQPWHEQFPADWTSGADGLTRAVFVASTQALENDLLVNELLEQQARA